MLTRSLLIVMLGCMLIGPSATAEETMNASGANIGDVAQETFAGGCFWCMQQPFEKLNGVIAVVAGYTGGTEQSPTYEQVSSGSTGHAESVEVTYDPSKISYEQLLEVFWHNIDPTTRDQQFADHGHQYRTAIFYHTEEQQRLAAASKATLAQSGKLNKPIVTEIVPATPFYPAEAYHQDYDKKNPVHYKLYRFGSGRDAYLQKTWGTSDH